MTAGAMLLLASKEGESLAALTQLAASGVEERAVKPARLSAARCQSFFSDSLTANMTPASSRSAGLAEVRGSPPHVLPEILHNADEQRGLGSFLSAEGGPSQVMYSDVAAAGAQVTADIARESRQKRLQSRTGQHSASARKPPRALPSTPRPPPPVADGLACIV